MAEQNPNAPQQGPQLGPLPTQLDPRALALMMQLSQGQGQQPQATAPPQAQAGPAPQPSPSQPTSQDALMNQYQIAAQKGGAATEEAIRLGKQESQVPMALPWAPHMRPLSHEGRENEYLDTGKQHSFIGNLLHNILESALAVGAATGPGQAIKSIGENRARQTRSQEIAGIQAEQEPQEKAAEFYGKTAESAGRLSYEQGMLKVRQQSADTAKDRVTAYSQSIKDRARNFAATQDWRNAALDERKRSNVANEAQRAADEAGRDYRERNRDATMEEVAQIVTGTKQQIANEAAARDPSVKSWLFNALGIDVPQIQGAQSPEFRETPKAGAQTPDAKPPAKPTAKPKSGGNVIKYDSQGNRIQ